MIGKTIRSLRVKLRLRMKYLWRLAIPLWIFRDASQGTAEQRTANYRYNRARRTVLPFYVGKWLGIAACMLQLTQILSHFMSTTVGESSAHFYATLACTISGIGFAFSCVVISVLFFSYLFLCYVKK